MSNINLGGNNLSLRVDGVDEALEKLNMLLKKLEEANSLIKEIASIEVSVSFMDGKVVNYD